MCFGRGDIIHSYSVSDIDHGKFFIVLNVTSDSVVGFFFINSRINKVIESRPEQFQLQYLIRPCDYPFLTHDSFICGSNIIEIPVETLKNQFRDKVARVVDSLAETDMSNLMSLCRKSRLYSPRQKKRYFY